MALALAHPQPQPTATAPVPLRTVVMLPAIAQEDKRRQERIDRAQKAYRGEWGSGPLKVGKDGLDDNVRLNRMAPVVDKGVSFLFGEPVKIEVKSNSATGEGDDDDGTAKKSPAQQYLDQCWGHDDDKMSLLAKLAQNGAIAGQVFLLINQRRAEQMPHLTVVNPRDVVVITDPEDCDVVHEYWIQSEERGTDAQGNLLITTRRKVICHNDPDASDEDSLLGYDMGDTWTISDYVRRGSTPDSGEWVQRGEPILWAHPFPPLCACQNLPNPNEHWGQPDLTPDLLEMNRVLNFIESNIARILKYHAHPKTWGKGFDVRQLDVSVDGVIGLPSADGMLQNLEMRGDLASSLNFAATLRGDMDEQSRVPAVALGRESSLPKGNISGVALQLLFQPLIEKTTLKQRLYGRLIRDVSQWLLCLGGFGDGSGDELRVELHWANLLPIDDLAAAQTGLVYQQLGVSQDTIMQQLGFDSDAEADKHAKEDARKLVNYARGQGLPVKPPAGAQPPAQQQQPGQPSPQGNGGNMPPVNHPAAQAARAAAQAAGAAMKGAR